MLIIRCTQLKNMITINVTEPIKAAVNQSLHSSNASLIWKSELEKVLEDGFLSPKQYKRLVEFVKKEKLPPIHKAYNELKVETPKLQVKEIDPEVIIVSLVQMLR